ncbi:Mu transposase domain-containing protein [Enterococcus raffinosus]|uniref:Mu transposase domain-containing protein n=1 Tax=Enterococcus raffinosus TaxID=71452 RepID=UPI00209D2558|nr:transposase [Enterococcus raffinosus]
MKQEDWITAHVHAYNFFGGVTEILVPDNLKTGVKRAKRGEAVLNEQYQELAQHYGTVVIPARVRTPKDKASVEGTVGNLSTWIIASLRNGVYFTLEELNVDIFKKLTEFNERPFTKKYKQGNRIIAFEEEEKFALRPLPQTPFKMATWKIATVQLDYMISVDSMFYSVPYEYIQNKVDVRVTKNLVEVFYKDSRIASHKRLYGKFGQFSTNRDHMPDKHKLYVDHTKESILAWAKSIGEATTTIVSYIFDSTQAEKQALKSTLRLKNQGKKYSSLELEQACTEALRLVSHPTVRVIETILMNNKKTNATKKLDVHKKNSDYGFTRGADYFGGKN